MSLTKKTGALAALAGAVLIGGTWAYFNETASLANPFSTTKYGSSVIEHFKPSDGVDWKPGSTISKTIAAENTGEAALLVRVKMTETWSRSDAEGNAVPFAVVASSNKTVFNDLSDVMNAVQAGEHGSEDGLVPAYTEVVTSFDDVNKDHTVVHKELNLGDGENQWFDGGDGFWYWNGILPAGRTTEKLLKSVTLAGNLDRGVEKGSYAYYIGDEDTKPAELTEKDWIATASEASLAKAAENLPKDKKFFMKSESGLDPLKMGYADASYELEIETQFIQVNKNAVEKEWGESVPAEIMALVD